MANASSSPKEVGMVDWKRVVIGNIHGHTTMRVALTAMILGVTRENHIVVVPEQARYQDRFDAETLCIEVGPGGIKYSTFDTCLCKGGSEQEPSYHQAMHTLMPEKHLFKEFHGLLTLAEYVDRVNHTESPDVSDHRRGELGAIPRLSGVFVGMESLVLDPVTRLHLGVEIYQDVVREEVSVLGRQHSVPDSWGIYIAQWHRMHNQR